MGDEAVHVFALNQDLFKSLVAEHDLTSAEIIRLVRRRMMRLSLVQALPQLRLEQIRRISTKFELANFSPETIIIRQGDPADRFFIVVRGQVEVLNHYPSGRDILLARLGEGDYFGEIGLLKNSPLTLPPGTSPCRM